MSFASIPWLLRTAALVVFAFQLMEPPHTHGSRPELVAISGHASAALPVAMQTQQPANENHRPVDSHKRNKAGLLAGVGLAVLSLLALATALALVRALKR